jgi:hypothetical protein
MPEKTPLTLISKINNLLLSLYLMSLVKNMLSNFPERN